MAVRAIAPWAAARDALTRAEHLSGQPRREALTQLATQLNGDAQGAAAQAKVRTLAAAVLEVASALKFPQSSTSALMRTMTAFGYLHYDTSRRTYIPTPRVSMLPTFSGTSVT